MRIVQILPTLESGGVETGTVDLARALTQRGHRAIVISGGGRLVKELEEAGVKHYELPVYRKRPWTIALMIPKVARILKEERADLVHARSRVPGWIAYFASRMAGVKFVTTCHGWYRTHWMGVVMAWGARVVVASESIGRHMHDDFHVPIENIHLIPRGVDLAQFSFRGNLTERKGGPVIGMIGRLTPLKGHEVLIRALGPLSKKMPGLRVKIVGTAPKGKEKYRQGLELLIRRMGLEHAVSFVGDRRDIPKILESLDLLVVPTITPEAFGRVVIEAQAVGVPVIASRVGGLAEVIEDGKTGLLVPAQDPSVLAQRIEELMADPGRAAEIVQKAHEKVESKFGLGLMVDRTVKLYEEVIQEKRIAIFKLGALGDLILATPSIRMIRKQFPKAHITLVTDPAFAPLVSTSPYLDSIMVYDRARMGRSVHAIMAFSQDLRMEHFDMTVDLQSNTLTYLFAFLSGAPERYGYRRKITGRFLNRGIGEFKRLLPPVEHQFQVLKSLGITEMDPGLELWTQREDVEAIERFLEEEWMVEKQVLIGVHVGASGRWASKRWPTSYLAELGDLLAKKLNARVVLTGDRDEVIEARRLASQMTVKPIMAVGRTSLTELVELIRRCDVFVCPDTAPLHIAATVGTPLVTLFGPTNPERHVPPGAGHRVLHTKISCSPCYQPVCPKKHHRCMRDIRPEQVLAEIEAQINSGGVKP